MNSTLKTLTFWVVIVFSAFLFWQIVRSNSPNAHAPEINYSTFVSEAQAGKIARVSITGSHIKGQYRDGSGMFQLTGPNNPAVYLGTLQEKGVEIQFRDIQTQNIPLQLLGTWAPLILLVVLWFCMIRILRRRTSPGAAGGTVDPSNRQPLTPQ